MTFDLIQNKVAKYFQGVSVDLKDFITKLSTETIGWIGILLCHAATIPTLLGLMFGITDNPPPIDMVLILWVGMALLYFKSILEKNIVSIIIIGLGFIAQSVLMALVFFK